VQGDCDDAATLTAALCNGVGIECALQAVAFDRADAPFTHVFTWAFPRGGQPRNMDVSHPDDAPPRAFTRRLTVRV
jgi:transglutaminase-like putative cysteine protease